MATIISPQKNNLGILVGGGPAPGINGVISAITLEARTRAHRVIGIYDGFHWLMKGDINHVKELDHDDEKLRQLAQAASSAQHFCSAEQFRDRYQYLTTDLRGCI